PVATVFIDAGTSVGRLYFYAMTARSDEGGSGATQGGITPVQKILVPPAQPFGLTVRPGAGTNMFLQWSMTSAGVVSLYNLYRSTAPGTAESLFAQTFSIGSTSYTDTALPLGQ